DEVALLQDLVRVEGRLDHLDLAVDLEVAELGDGQLGGGRVLEVVVGGEDFDLEAVREAGVGPEVARAVRVGPVGPFPLVFGQGVVQAGELDSDAVPAAGEVDRVDDGLAVEGFGDRLAHTLVGEGWDVDAHDDLVAAAHLAPARELDAGRLADEVRLGAD